MTEEEDDDLLVEEVAGAHRPRPREELRYHPAWHDLMTLGVGHGLHALPRALPDR